MKINRACLPLQPKSFVMVRRDGSLLKSQGAEARPLKPQASKARHMIENTLRSSSNSWTGCRCRCGIHMGWRPAVEKAAGRKSLQLLNQQEATTETAVTWISSVIKGARRSGELTSSKAGAAPTSADAFTIKGHASLWFQTPFTVSPQSCPSRAMSTRSPDFAAATQMASATHLL